MISRHEIPYTSINRDFHERILTIDDASDIAVVNKIPSANEHGYLDNSWLQDYSSYKIIPYGDTITDFTTDPEYSEYVYILNLRSTGLKITLTGNEQDESLPYSRALVYRFLIYNEYGYDLTWKSSVDGAEFIWNTYSETPPTLDANGTYIEFITTDGGLHWYGTTSNRTAYDLVNNYYTKVESDDRFVNVDGDTMHGNYTINGGSVLLDHAKLSIKNNAFNDNISLSLENVPIKITNTSISKRSSTSSDVQNSDQPLIYYYDKDGKVVSFIRNVYTVDGDNYSNVSSLSVFNPGDNSTFTSIRVGYNQDGPFTSAHTPATDDRSSNIATTAYVRNYIDTINLVPDMDNSTMGSFLTNDGTDSYWVRYNRTPYVHYTTSETDTITVPTEYLQNATIVDVYRDGVLLVDPDDYTFNFTSGVVNFSETIHENEKIIVMLESTVITHNNEVFNNVTLNNSSATTPSSTDNSSRIATTAWVMNVLSNYTPSGGGGGSIGLSESKTEIFDVTQFTTDVTLNPDDLPEDGISYTMAVYHDGVRLTDGIDYDYDENTYTISFNRSFMDGDRVVVYIGLFGEGYDSSTISGEPLAPTAPTGTNNNQIATTEFVNNSIAAANHAPINSPNFTGIPTAPKAEPNTNTTQIATTSFVTGAINTITGDDLPSSLNTIKKLAQAINNRSDYSVYVDTRLDNKLNTGIQVNGSGNALTDIVESNGNITISKDYTFSLSSHNHDNDYTALKQNVGGTTIPIYTDDDGVLTPFTATVGDVDTPVYLNSGSITTTGKHFSDYLLLTGGTITGQLSINTEDQPAVSIGDPNGEHLEIDNNSIQAKYDSNTEATLFLNKNGGDIYLGNGVTVSNNGTLTANAIVGNFGGSVDSATKDGEGNVITETYLTKDSPELQGTPTAPTPAPNNNSNQVATTSYVDLAISSLVNSSPEALDTLNELATALGNDPNFATTITNSLSEKVAIGSGEYLKNITLDGNTLTVVSGNDSETELVIPGTEYTAGIGINISNENEISAQDQLPDQTDNEGKFLYTDGNSASWEEIYPPLKISSVHYPSNGDTTITLTAQESIPENVSNYSLAVYRNGIYLNNVVDYTFDLNTRILTFNLAFDANEIVTVVFSYIGNEAQDSYSYVVLGEGNAVTNAVSQNGVLTLSKDTTFVTVTSPQTITGDKSFTGSLRSRTRDTSDNSTRVATTEYVNNRLTSSIEKVTTVTAEDNTITLDPNTDTMFNITLNSNVNITINNITNTYYDVNGAVLTIFMPAHNYVVTWDNRIVWDNNTAPDLSSNYNIITITSPDGGTVWFGTYFSVNYTPPVVEEEPNQGGD